MDQLIAALDAAWRVLVVALILGAGLPTLYAVGIRTLAWAHGVNTPGTTPTPGRRIGGRIAAIALFAIVISAVLLGIAYIIAHGFGWTVEFVGLTPVVRTR